MAAKMNESQAWLNIANHARQEAIDFLLHPSTPAILKGLMPLTNDGKTLYEGAEQVMRLWQQIAEAYRAYVDSPWYEFLEFNPRFIDWSGFSGVERMSLSMRPAKAGPILGMPPIKHGRGIDPADGQEKEYADFNAVAAKAREVGVWEYYQLDRRYLAIRMEECDPQNAGDAEKLDRLSTIRSDIVTQMEALHLAWDIRRAGPENGRKVQSLYELREERSRLEHEVTPMTESL